MLSDRSLRAISVSIFLYRSWVRASQPLLPLVPASAVSAVAAPLCPSPLFLSGCSLQAVPAPCRLVCVHWSVLRILLSSLELDFWGGEEVLGDVYFVSQKILLTLKAP